MKRATSTKDWLPLAKRAEGNAELPTGEAFRSEWIDFERGIRVGNLEPHERITQILKFHLEQRYHTPFVTDRWGRGVYWQWICWLPRANREAMPQSHGVNFGCSKLFLTARHERRIFQSGLQVERGYLTGPEADRPWGLRDDWDWHRLVRQCRAGTPFERELARLIKREGFVAAAVGEAGGTEFARKNFESIGQVRRALAALSPNQWGGFQLYYPMSEAEVRECSGYDLVKAVTGVFDEVVPAMNACLRVPLEPPDRR